jgi:hypothetical protein
MQQLLHYTITLCSLVLLIAGLALMPAPEQVAQAVDNTYSVLSPLPGTGNEVNTDEPGTYLQTMYQVAVALAAILAVVMLVVGGFQYMTSEAFNTKEQAKTRIWGAIGGLLLILASWLILNVVNPELLKFDFGNLRSGIQDSVQGGSAGAETDTQGGEVAVRDNVPNYPDCPDTSDFPCTVISYEGTIPSEEQSQCESKEGSNARAYYYSSSGMIDCLSTVNTTEEGVAWCNAQPSGICTTEYGNLRETMDGYVFTVFTDSSEANEACSDAGGSWETESGIGDRRHCTR